VKILMSDTDIDSMTLEQTRAAAQELLDNTTGDLAGADAERFQALTGRATQLREHEQQRATARRDLMEALASGRAMLEGEGSGVQPYSRDEDREPAMQQRDDAMRVLERCVKTDRLGERGAELVEELCAPAHRSGRPGPSAGRRRRVRKPTSGLSRRNSPTPTTANSPGPQRKPTPGAQ
jgi:hypothetical protein